VIFHKGLRENLQKGNQKIKAKVEIKTNLRSTKII